MTVRVVVGIVAMVALGVGQTKTLISGRVVGRDSSGLRYATVTLVEVEGKTIEATVETDQFGQFLFAGISPGEYEARFQAPGFKKVVARVRAVPGWETQLGSIAMEPAPTYTQNVIFDPVGPAPSAEEALRLRVMELPLMPVLKYDIILGSIF